MLVHRNLLHILIWIATPLAKSSLFANGFSVAAQRRPRRPRQNFRFITDPRFSTVLQHGFRYLSAGCPDENNDNGCVGRGEYPAVIRERDEGTVRNKPPDGAKRRKPWISNSPSYWYQNASDPQDLKGRAELQATRAILQRRHTSLEQSQYELRKSQTALESAQSELKQTNLQLRLSKSTISSLSDKVVALQQEILDLRQAQKQKESSLTTEAPDQLMLELRIDEEQERYWKRVYTQLHEELKEMQVQIEHQNTLLQHRNRGLVPMDGRSETKKNEANLPGLELGGPAGGWNVESDFLNKYDEDNPTTPQNPSGYPRPGVWEFP